MHPKLLTTALTTALLLFTAIPSTFAQEATPPRYSIGTVPDQSVWPTGKTFLLHWNNLPDISMDLQLDPAPLGAFSLAPLNAIDWEFTYLPDPADRLPFTVTITASNGPDSLTDSWIMNPQASLQPEASSFGTQGHTQPVAANTYGISVFDQPRPLKEVFNYGTNYLHDIRIVGETIELTEGHENGLYEAYFNGDRRDIATLEIIAETITITSPARLKQTDVTLIARELRFENTGSLQTTPQEQTESKGSNGSGGIAGDDGLPAGNITLHLESLVSDTPEIRFNLTGGRGQPGGPGAHGSDGAPISGDTWTSVKYCDSGICKTHNAPSGYRIVYWYYTFLGTTPASGGVNRWPGNGTDAKPSGKPGEGGNAGSITSNVEIDNLVLASGGLSAQPTWPTTSPTSYYRGGSAGYPSKAQKVHFYLDWLTMKSSAENHTSTAGKNADVRLATTTAGQPGTATVTPTTYNWLHPLSLRKILNHIKDDYLANQITTAHDRLADYSSLLNQYQADGSWQLLDPQTRFELTQMHEEINLLLQRIEAGLDYFGNPAGWVPMLSFEVNTTLYQNEIDRAINLLYLTYWIKNKAQDEQQRLDALTTVRDALRDELAEAKTSYNEAVTRLPVLRTEATSINHEILSTQFALEAEENRLLQETGEPDWVMGLRLGLKVSAMMCQMVPVYQPALGAVGEGLRLASDFDPNNPWNTITSAPNVASAYLDSDFEDSANDEKTATDSLDPDAAEEEGFDYLGAIQTAGTGLMKGVDDIQQFLKEREAPTPEMLAELEELKAKSPTYKTLIERVETLMERNRQFADDILSTMQDIASFSNIMRRNLLAIDALNRQIAPAATVLDDRATSYLEDMERRAYDRLLKYHYYMAKAYEYRLLQPYEEPLNLEGLIQKFQDIANLHSDHTITPEQFNSLRAVFEENLALVAETIFDHYNANRPDLSVPVRFSLSPEEINQLNAGQTVSINLKDEGFFAPTEENIRIVDLNIFAITAQPANNGAYGSTAYVDVFVEHSGVSKLKLDGSIFQFRHYNQLTENPVVWGGRFDPIDNQIDPFHPSDASDSLLRSLLSGDAVSDMLLYSRPSAWADLTISATDFSSNGNPINLQSLRFEMTYDFTPRKANLGLRDLELLVTTTSTENPTPQQSSILPYFTLGNPDYNGRQDARGRFLRVFQNNGGSVQINAPTTYGKYQFQKWTDRFGSDLPGGPYTSPAIELSTLSDQTLVAQYGPASASNIRIPTPAWSGQQLQISWQGGNGLRLQTSPSLLPNSWTDVPNTDGASSTTITPSSQNAYFRIVGP
ncbi:MAG: hypothetical protein RI897_186 [Verrucomicrobiota bacterium]